MPTVWQLLFCRNPYLVSLPWLERLCRWFHREADDDKLVSWLAGPFKRGGRPRILDEVDDDLVVEIMKHSVTLRLRLLRSQFAEIMGHDGAVSISSFWRSKKRSRLTRKGLTRLCALANPADQLEFLRIAEPLQPGQVTS